MPYSPPDDTRQMQRLVLDQTQQLERLRSRFRLATEGMFDAEAFRALVKVSSPAMRVTLCRMIAAESDPLPIVPIVAILLEEAGPELEHELRQLLEGLRPSPLETLLAQLLGSQERAKWDLACQVIRNRQLGFFVPVLEERWPLVPPPVRMLLADTLLALDSLRGGRFLLRRLRREDDPGLLAYLLTLALGFQQERGRHWVFAAYLEHPEARVRHAAVRGLAATGKWYQRRSLFRCFCREQDQRVLEALIHILQETPTRAFARELVRLGIEAPEPAVRELAGRGFRQLPDRLVLQCCLPLLRRPDRLVFALTELSFLNDARIPPLLRQAASNRASPEPVRAVAIEGLAYHAGEESIECLLRLFKDEGDQVFLTYTCTLSLVKLWDQRHLAQIGDFLELDPERYAMEVQTVLSMLARKLRARKLHLDERIVTRLIAMATSDNVNCALLAISALDASSAPLDIETLLPLLERSHEENVYRGLRQLLAKRLGAQATAFQSWLLAPERSEQAVLRGLELLSAAQATPAQEASLFLGLLVWKRPLSDDEHTAWQQRVLLHLARLPETRQEIGQRLTSGTRDYTDDLLFHGGIFAPAVFQEIAQGYLLARVDEGMAEVRVVRCISMLCRLHEATARRELMKLYLKRPELMGVVGRALQAHLAEVS